MTTDNQPEKQKDTPVDTGRTDHSRDMFKSALDETFTLQLDEEKSVPLKLVAVADSEFSNSEFDCFSLYLLPPKGELPLPDASYRVSNANLGEMFLHLSATLPASCDPQEYEYEAIFNLRKKEG